MGGPSDVDVEALRSENEELKRKVEELQDKVEELSKNAPAVQGDGAAANEVAQS